MQPDNHSRGQQSQLLIPRPPPLSPLPPPRYQDAAEGGLPSMECSDRPITMSSPTSLNSVASYPTTRDSSNPPKANSNPTSSADQSRNLDEERSGAEIATAALGHSQRAGQVPFYIGTPPLPLKLEMEHDFDFGQG